MAALVFDRKEGMLAPRLYVEQMTLGEGVVAELPEGAAKHAQVLRLQPGSALTLFDGQGGEWAARVCSMGRREVIVEVLERVTTCRELPVAVTLVVGMPANDRMAALVEKATELGVAAVQPLMCDRSVLRLDGERAVKKVAHWQAVAVSASEQSGRTQVPTIQAVMTFKQWMAQAPLGGRRAVLSFQPELGLADWCVQRGPLVGGQPEPVNFLSGPEGGLSPSEESAARAAGWIAVGLGPRTLRADTAPLMALSCLAALLGSG